MPSGKRVIGDLTHALAGELRAEVGRQALSQRALALAADMPLATVSKILRGAGAIDVEQLYALCDALDVEARDVLEAAEGVAAELALSAAYRAGQQEAVTSPAGAATESATSLADRTQVPSRPAHGSSPARARGAASSRSRRTGDGK